MERFNVTLMQVDGYPHTMALVEAVDYLRDCIERCGHQAQKSTNCIMNDAHNVVVCGHLLNADQVSGLPLNTVVFNSEHLDIKTDWHLSSGVYRKLIDGHFVWDYCADNLAQIGHEAKAQIPFYYCKALQRTDIVRTPGRALLFYGALNNRRKRILARLKTAGIKIRTLFNVYGDARDTEMLNCWAVLNLHKSDESRAFEPIRCFYPLINGVPVITEPFSADPLSDAFRACMHVAGERTLTEEVAALYKDRDGFAQLSAERAKAFVAADPLPAVRVAVANYLAYFSERS